MLRLFFILMIVLFCQAAALAAGETNNGQGGKGKAMKVITPEEMIIEGEKLEAKEQFQSALEIYQAVLASSSKTKEENRPLRINIAKLLSWTNQFDKSISLYKELVAEKPDDTGTRIALARVLAWKGSYDESLAIYDDILKNDPNNTEAVSGKATVYYYRGQSKLAKEWVKKAMALNPNDPDLITKYHNLEYVFDNSTRVGYNINTFTSVREQLSDFYIQLNNKPVPLLTTTYRIDRLSLASGGAYYGDTMLTADAGYDWYDFSFHGLMSFTPTPIYYPNFTAQGDVKYKIFKMFVVGGGVRYSGYSNNAIVMYIPEATAYFGKTSVMGKLYHAINLAGAVSDSIVGTVTYEDDLAHTYTLGVSNGSVNFLDQTLLLTNNVTTTTYFGSVKFPITSDMWSKLTYENQAYTLYTRHGLTAELIYNW